jgi:16S rRNA (cytosine1402-N4)-methyltransferase
LVRDNFSNLAEIVKAQGLEYIDGIIFDLGVSSHQLDKADRGFSYNQDAPLDMRMDQRNDISAWEVVNRFSEEDLRQIIRDYGEESWANRIAQFLCARRKEKSIDTTGELVEIIKDAIPAKFRRRGPHPAKRTFQALRIFVNDEMNILRPSILDAVKLLRRGGRICVITFHSLEDRIIKNTFKELSVDCVCPKEAIVCTCNHKKTLEILTPKPIYPSKEEVEENPRSRSAKLRAAQRV